MQLVLATAPIFEPITPAELKLHLRLDSGSFADNIDESQSLVPDQYVVADNFTTHVGTGIEVLGYTAVVILDAGATSGTGSTTVKIQECDTLAGTYTDWKTFTPITTANHSAIQEEAYTGTKRYIKVVAKVENEGCSFGVSVIRLTATMIEDDLLDAIITAGREHVEDITRRKIITQTWDFFLDGWPNVNYIALPDGNLQSITSVKYTDSDGAETNLTKAITAFADSATSPGTKTTVTSAAHGYSDGDTVHISGTTSYNGGWEISNVETNKFDITMAFVADDATGTASTYYIVETNGEMCGRIVLPYGATWPSFTAYPSNPIAIRYICGWTTRALVPYKIKAALKLICSDLYSNREAQIVSGQNYQENKTVMRLLASARLWDEF